VKRLKDLPRHFVKELEEFFVNYHELDGKTYKLLGCKGAAAAWTLIDQARKAA
jgi:inorganic pyrophosphatase